MKTSEDKLNEALRAALKRKFDHFEDEPNPSAFQKIRANLKPGRQWKYLFFTMLFVGVSIVAVITDQHYAKTNIAKKAVLKEAFKKAEAEITVAKINLVGKQPAATLASNPEKPAAISHSNNKSHKPALPPVANNIESDLSATAGAERENNLVNPQLSESLKPDQEKDAGSVSGKNQDDLFSSSSTMTIGNRDIDISVSEIDNQPVTFASIQAGKLDIHIPKTETKPVVKHDKGNFNWLINAAILQSYQILTVPSGAQSFQNFEFPSTFSLRSMGYKLSLGAEKKGFQFMLHFSRFQQSYSYEIAGNDYIVQTFDKDHFKVIRQGTRVSQDNKFRLIGVGINKQVSWGNASVGKYYASAGLEYSYGLIRKQSIGWVNAGIGKQFPINRKSSLHIGPYAEFSPVKFSGSGDPFYYQPYRVGISAGLRWNR